VIDIVHKDFFEKYLDSHLVPFSKRFAERVLRHPTELASGSGFVPALGAHGFSPLEGRLRPRGPGRRVSQGAAIIRNLARLVTGRRSLR
jgi:hypothetical protein